MEEGDLMCWNGAQVVEGRNLPFGLFANKERKSKGTPEEICRSTCPELL